MRRLHTVTLRTPLTTALRLLLESGCSSLPVLDEVRHLFEGRRGLLSSALWQRGLLQLLDARVQVFLSFALLWRCFCDGHHSMIVCICTANCKPQ